MLDVGDLFVEALVLEPVGIDLRLIVLELGDHVLELLGPLLQVLLIHLKLLGHLGPALLRQDVLQLYVELLLLLDEHVLLGDLLSLGDEALLERLDLLNKLVGLGVRTLELAPTVDVQGLVELVCEELSFLLLLKELFLLEEDLAAEVGDAGGLVLGDDQFALELGDLVLNTDYISYLLLIVDFALVECGLLNLDLLI